MTKAALCLLGRNPEASTSLWKGHINHSHHESRAYLALTRTVSFEDATERASRLTNEKAMLTLVTTDHSHVLIFGGYPLRGSSIFRLAPERTSDGKVYTSILYGNGKGFAISRVSRSNISNSQSGDPKY